MVRNPSPAAHLAMRVDLSERASLVSPARGEVAPSKPVMPGLDPGIHVLTARNEGVDGRVKPGHDGGVVYAANHAR
jgi:hypothetical protein